MKRKYSPTTSKDVERELHSFKKGKLRSGKGGMEASSKAGRRP